MTGKYPPSSGKSFKVGQNHDGCKAISTTLLVLKWSRAIFWSRSSKPSVPSFYLCPFLCKLRPSGVSLESSGLENIPQVPGNGAKIGQTHHARKAVLATLVALKWGGAIFRPRSSKLSVRSFYLCLFLCTPRPSGVSSESPGLKSIPQVPGNRAKVCQIHHARKAVSATLSVLKWSGLYFGLEAWNRAGDCFTCVHFSANQGDQKLVWSPRDWKISPKFREIKPKIVKITMRVRRSRLLFQS